MSGLTPFIQDDILHINDAEEATTAEVRDGVLHLSNDEYNARVIGGVLYVNEIDMSPVMMKALIETYGKQIDLTITHGADVYKSEKIISCNISYEGSILTAVMRQAEIELDDVGGQEYAEVMKGESINITLKVSAWGVVTKKKFGTFIVKDAEYHDDTNSVTLTCYDLMLLSMVTYTPVCDFESTVTLGGYLASICNHLGLTLATETFTNSDVEIDGEKYDNQYTFRDALTEIAQAAGGTIAIKNDLLYVLYPNDTGLTVDPSNLKTSKVGELYGPVTSVVLARTPQEDNIYKRDETLAEWTEVKIANNQLMDSHREDFIEGLYERLYGLQYYPYEVESFGIVYLDVCDRFTLTTLDGKEYNTIFLGSNLEITQGINESSKLEPLTVTETDYTAASETDRVINKTILRVNKQEQVIEGLVTKTESQYNEITGQMEELTKEVSTKITPEQVSIAISAAVEGIDGAVVKSTGYTFNEEGLRIKRSDSEIENLLTHKGMYVNREDDNVLTADHEGVQAINLKSKQFLIIGENSRFEDFETNRTACFYIGGN